MTRSPIAIAANRRALGFALASFDPADLPAILADALVQRFGRNRAETILQDAAKDAAKETTK